MLAACGTLRDTSLTTRAGAASPSSASTSRIPRATASCTGSRHWVLASASACASPTRGLRAARLSSSRSNRRRLCSADGSERR